MGWSNSCQWQFVRLVHRVDGEGAVILVPGVMLVGHRHEEGLGRVAGKPGFNIALAPAQHSRACGTSSSFVVLFSSNQMQLYPPRVPGGASCGIGDVDRTQFSLFPRQIAGAKP